MSIGNEGQQKNKNIQSKLLLKHLAAGDKELLKLTHQLKTLNLNIIMYSNSSKVSQKMLEHFSPK
ncbi:hypothetical protein ACA351_04055 [Orientia tsutsugamushi]|uniref:hypothetical protein n=1 Tax=Orientia tsutsugamushi TaxID=784 RepID=UPI0035287545